MLPSRAVNIYIKLSLSRVEEKEDFHRNALILHILLQNQFPLRSGSRNLQLLLTSPTDVTYQIWQFFFFCL